MNIFRSMDKISPPPPSSVIAIGNFDGVHLGHRKILNFLKKRARRRNIPAFVLTFYPHPRQVIEGIPHPLIQTQKQRLERLEELGIENVVVLDFNKRFAHITADDFIKDIIIRYLKVREIIVGRNFSFGRNREGNVYGLRRRQRRFGFRVFSVSSVIRNGKPVSSSIIRKFLQEGRMQEASRLLGRPYQISGTVIPGRSQGRMIGYPTANIESANDILSQGVFLTETKMEEGTCPSLTNIGRRPTFNGEDISVETHLLGQHADLYGKELTILFHKKLRDEIRFDSPEALAARIKADIHAAGIYFGPSLSGNK